MLRHEYVGDMNRRRFRLVLAIFLAWQGTGLVMCPDETSFAEMRLPVSAQLLRSGSSVALQGLRPILPGHCLVVPERPVPRLRDLPEDAMLDLWRTTLQANQQLLKQLGATASNWAVFDGWQAGQPVQHTHVHVVPRKPKDLERNDEVYEALERWKPSEAEGGEPPPIAWPTDEARKKRDSEEMAAEAAGYRALLPGAPRGLEQNWVPRVMKTWLLQAGQPLGPMDSGPLPETSWPRLKPRLY
ncbi:unnamed protein product [Effrenium voratum]|nr:unnamed protein product [Effrenium voratum]